MIKYYVKSHFYNGIRNEFFMLEKETPKMLKLVKVLSKRVSGDCWEGTEIPTPEKDIDLHTSLIKNKYCYEQITIRKDNKEYHEWDGNPVRYDHLD